jgi:GntR family transcriptional regulator
MDAVFNNSVPIYLQIVSEIKKQIISGKLIPGERIPSVRELALTYKVNPNTMQKALTELEDMNLIYTERTNGKYVTNDAKLIESLKDEYAITLAKSYFQGMRRIGLGKADSIKYLEGIDE